MSNKANHNKSTKPYKAVATRPQLIALEPRVLFDGAALATIVDAQVTEYTQTTSVTDSSVEFTAALSAVSTASEIPSEIDVTNIESIDGLTGNTNPDLVSLTSTFQINSADLATSDIHLLQIANAGTISDSLATGLVTAEHLVYEFLNSSDAKQQMFTLFNGGQVGEPSAAWNAAFDMLMTTFKNGETPVRVELRSNAELQGAKGAFSIQGTTGQATIYLNSDWLAGNPSAEIGGADSASIQKVLVEELGHFLDAKLNDGLDTAGDEGEIFSRYIVDGTNPLSISFLNNQNDQITLEIDGQTVKVELASFSFVGAYKMVYDLNNNNAVVGSTGETAAEKEQSTHNFNTTQLGAVTISDGNVNGTQFSGNDVSAIAVVIGDQTYYGWISRPIKSGGIVRGFYFWTDLNFTDLAAAQYDGNQDRDGTASDNRGFLLVVDQTWFTQQITAQSTTVSLNNTFDGNLGPVTYSTIGSSSDRVDSALNSLVTSNAAPIATNDTANGTPGTTGGAALEQGYNTNISTVITATVNATGNVLTNDVDSNNDSLTVSNIKSNVTGQTTAVSSSGSYSVVGKYGTLTISANGAYTYVVDNNNPTINALLSNSLTEVFTYTASDNKGGTATATLTVQINGSNDAPVAVNDYNTAKEHTSPTDTGYNATGNVLPNDTDVDSGDTKSITGISQLGTADASNIVSITTTSSVRFDGGSGFGPSTVEGKTLYLNVSGVYRAIHGSNDALVYALAGGTTVYSGSVYDVKLSQDVYYYNNGVTKVYLTLAELAGKNVGFKSDTAETTGTNSMKTATLLTTTSAGTYTIDLANYSGSIAVGSKLWYDNDASAGVNYVDSLLTVQSITYDANGVPTKVTLDGRIPFSNGTPIQFRSSLTAGVQYSGQYGQLTLNANGSYTYVPYTNNPAINAGDVVVEVFDYTMQDAAGVTSSAKLYITVYGDGTNSPTLVSDSGTAYESGVGRNSTSPYTLTNDSTSFVGVNATGNVLTNDSAGNITSYSKEDGTGSVSAGTTLTGTYGQLSINSSGVYTYIVNNSNSTVNALAPGQTITETFWYTMNNSSGVSGKSTLVITIQGTNDAPVAVVDNGGTLVEDAKTLASGNVLGNDTDVDLSDTKTVTKIIIGSAIPTTSVAANSTSSNNGTIVDGVYGRLIIGADGTYTYNLGITAAQISAVQALNTTNHPTETFTYQVTDSYGATGTTTLNFTVDGSSEPPVNLVNGNSFSNTSTLTYTTSANTAITFVGGKSLSVSDADGDLASVVLTVEHGTLSFTSGTGSATLSSTSGSTITISGTQSEINAALALLQYTPTTNYTGSDYLTISSRDSTNLWDSDAIAINIPTAFTGPTVKESDLSTGSNPSGTEETKSSTLFAPAGQTFGSATQSGNGTYGTWTFNGSTGVFTYTLTSAPSVNGISTTDTVNIVTYDNYGNAITNTVTVAINDDVPTANADTDSVTEDLTVTATGNVITGVDVASGNDSNTTDGVADSKGADGATVVGAQLGTVLTELSGSVGTAIDGVYGRLTINANGSYSYVLYTSTDAGSTATSGYSAVQALTSGQSLNETFSYTLKDTDGDFSNATLTITVNGSNEVPIFSVNDVTVNEGAGTAVFTVTRTGDSTVAADVSYALSNGTASSTSDYTTQSGLLSFAIGETSKTITVAITNDSIYEGSETFDVTLSSPTNGAIIGDAVGVGTILDDGTGSGGTNDDRPSFSINDVTVNEAAGTMTFTVTKTGSTTQSATVNYSFADDTATGGVGNDYTGTASTLTFASNETTKTITVSINNDSIYEGSESFKVDLSSATGATISDSQGIGTIKDDGTGGDDDGINTDDATDTAKNDDRPSFSINDVTVNEAAGTMTFTVTKTGSTTQSSTVNYSFVDDTATGGAGNDYAGTASTLTFASNETTKTITVSINNDSIYEGSESFKVNLSSATGATISDSQGIGTIKDDGTGGDDDGNNSDNATDTAKNDDRPSFSINDVTVNEVAGTMTFTVTKTGSTTQSATVNYSFADISAVGGVNDDYIGTAGTLTFAPNETTKTITVSINDDSIYEESEAFYVNLSSASGATISDAQAVGTIKDDGTGGDDDGINTDDATDTAKNDDRPSFSINDVTVNEAAGTMTFTVTKTGSTTQSATVNYSFVDDTATGGASNDYTGTAGTLTFSSGVTSQTITVSINNDSIYEGSESFKVNLSSATGATISDSQGIGTIKDDGTGGDDDGNNADNANDTAVNDDRGITVSGLDDVSEGSNSIFTVNLPDGNARNTEISLVLASGTANTSDYSNTFTAYYYVGNTQVTLTITGGKIILPSGITTFYVNVPTIQDTNFEGLENFSLSATITNGKSASDTSSILDNGTGKVYDDKGTNPSGPGNNDQTLSVSSPTVNEGSNWAVFTVDSLPGQVITLSLNEGSGSGYADVDQTQPLEYWNGSAWVDYTPGSQVTIPVSGTLLVRVDIRAEQDAPYEGAETFQLIATNLSGQSANGMATIIDDGTGNIYPDVPPTNGSPTTDPTATKDDDRKVDQYIPPAIPKPIIIPPEHLKPLETEITKPLPQRDPEPLQIIVDSNDPRARVFVTNALPLKSVLGTTGTPSYGVYDRVTEEVIFAQKAVDVGLSRASERDMELKNTVKPPDLQISEGSQFNYKLPTATFTGGKGDINLTAVQRDGTPLPAWIKFDPKTGKFTGEAPKNLSAPIDVRVIATDAKGDQAETKISIKSLGKRIGLKGKVPFSTQLEKASSLRS
jgi:VCBS repeat-containing protein